MRTVAPALILLACSDAEVAPTRAEGHGGGAGYWPPDSRTAVRGAFAQGLDVELDVVLTRDLVPMLALAPYVDAQRCRIDGEPVIGVHRWDGIGSRELATVECGGFPEADFPNAVVVGETPITLDEVLELLLDAPDDIVVHLDILHEPGFTPSPGRFAEAVLDRWIEADRPQDLVISGRRPELIAAFEGHGRERGFDVTTLLDLPLIEPGDGWGDLVARDLGHRITNTLDYVDAAGDAGADGINVLADLADRRQLEVARREGLITSVWTVDGERRLAPWLDRVDVVVTNYPGDLP
ncbi:MAG: hypothetical protein KC621_06960 [Myxococcales bacterium]|nr:hypothetical protein [Myxococcales bacterium]